MKPVLVLKVGTASITTASGEINQTVVEEICRQLAVLHERYRLIVVSSGAVGAGRPFIDGFSGTITERKAAAAIGNPLLIRTYGRFLEQAGITVAQSLCERHHFSHRHQFLQVKQTFESLWQHGVIPIVNENDVVSSHELKFSDNDELATLLATSFSAEKLLLGTSAPGLLDGDQVVSVVETFTADIFALADTRKKTEFGMGGMLSKLHAAKLATSMGTAVVIFDVREPGNILAAEQGETGTQCTAKACSISAHQKWIATGSLASGKLIIDGGAARALAQRKSLLMVGVREVQGEFEKGDIVEIYVEGEEAEFAIGRARLSSGELAKLDDVKGVEIVHADTLVLLDVSLVQKDS